MYICMHVCTYVCMHICAYVHMYACTYIHTMYACMYRLTISKWASTILLYVCTFSKVNTLILSVYLWSITLFHHSLLTRVADVVISIDVEHFNCHLIGLKKFTNEIRIYMIIYNEVYASYYIPMLRITGTITNLAT